MIDEIVDNLVRIKQNFANNYDGNAHIQEVIPLNSSKEFPINYSGRTYEQGKKITAFDGLDALFVLAKYRFFN